MKFPRPLPKDTLRACDYCDSPATTEWANGRAVCEACDARIYSHFPW